jgi:Protein of unknown function (DUF1659)
MAQVTSLSRNLQLQFQNGTTAKGDPKIQNHNFMHLSSSITDDDALSVGQAMGQLFALPVYQVAVVEQNALSAASTTGNGSTGTTTQGGIGSSATDPSSAQ